MPAEGDSRVIESMEVTLNRVFEVLSYRTKHRQDVVRPLTGIECLDEVLFGTDDGALIAVVARPGMGRSAFLQTVALNTGRRGSRLFYSIDLSADMTCYSMLANRGGIDSSRILTGGMTERDLERAAKAAGEMANLSLQLVDAYAMTIDDIVSHARACGAVETVGLIVIDGIELLGLSADETNHAVLTLRTIARELKATIFITGTVSRSAELRTNKRPLLSDVEMTPFSENAAECIIGLYRDEVYDRQTDQQAIIELIVMKNKHGPVGTVKVQLHTAHRRVSNLAPEDV